MKRLIMLLLFASVVCAQFQLQSTDISIKLNEDGSAIVEERVSLLIPSADQYTIQLYQSGFNQNTLANWQEITNISDIKTHVSSARTDIRNLIIRPQPLARAGLEYFRGQIIIDYLAYPFYTDGVPVNGTGLVTMSNYKPRTTRYILNENAFSLGRTDTGDIALDRTTTLSITPPSDAMITYLNPITHELLDAKFPVRAETLSWTDITLVQFSLAYEVEQTLDKEVSKFFSDFQDKLRSALTSSEGIAALLVAGVLVVSYAYLRLSRR